MGGRIFLKRKGGEKGGGGGGRIFKGGGKDFRYRCMRASKFYPPKEPGVVYLTVLLLCIQQWLMSFGSRKDDVMDLTQVMYVWPSLHAWLGTHSLYMLWQGRI